MHTYIIKEVGNIDRDREQDIIADGEIPGAYVHIVEVDEEEEDNINKEARSRKTSYSDNFLGDNTVNLIKCKVNDKPDKDCKAEGEEENDILSHIKISTTPLQSQAGLATFVETQPIAPTETTTPHLQSSVKQRLSHQQLLSDLGQQILNGQQIRVQNILDVARSLCSGEPIGALCDMSFSKMGCNTYDVNPKDEVQNSTDFMASKYYHPLYAHGVCRWPGCELPLEDMATFVNFIILYTLL